MAKISGKNGDIYFGTFVIESCDSEWNDGGTATRTSETLSTSSMPYLDGDTKYARAATTSIGATTLLMSKTISKDLSSYDGLTCWIRSSVATSSGDLQILIPSTSPDESLDIPALTADTWTRIFIPFADPSQLSSVASIGLYQVTDLADGNFDITDVKALKLMEGATNFSVSSDADILETTSFASAGVKEYIAAGSGWTCSFNIYKDGAPPVGPGNTYNFAFQESGSTAQSWLGRVVVTNISPNVAQAEIVSYSFSGQGTGYLQVPTL